MSKIRFTLLKMEEGFLTKEEIPPNTPKAHLENGSHQQVVDVIFRIRKHYSNTLSNFLQCIMV
jgi:hypothetical protein